MKAFFINIVFITILLVSSIGNATIPAAASAQIPTCKPLNEVFLHEEIDQAQEDYNEFVEKRRISKEDLEKVTSGEEFYDKIVKRFNDIKDYATIFSVETHVIVVFEDVAENVWEESVDFFNNNQQISIVPVMYVPESKEMLPIVRMEEDGTVEYLMDFPIHKEVVEAFCFILN